MKEALDDIKRTVGDRGEREEGRKEEGRGHGGKRHHGEKCKHSEECKFTAYWWGRSLGFLPSPSLESPRKIH